MSGVYKLEHDMWPRVVVYKVDGSVAHLSDGTTIAHSDLKVGEVVACLGAAWIKVPDHHLNSIERCGARLVVEKERDKSPNMQRVSEVRSRLLEYVGSRFDRCVEKGAIEEHCEMGELQISLLDAGWDEEKKLVECMVKPTMPLESLL